MPQNRFQSVLFYTFLALFCITAIIELCAMIGIVGMPHEYETKLFYAIIVEVAGTVFAFWKQITGARLSDPPAIGGSWGYEWVREDGNYKHGGDCALSVVSGPLGWEFSIHGKRTWEAEQKGGAWTRTELPAPYDWASVWGTFTGEDTLRFEFSIQTPEERGNSYGVLHVAEPLAKPAEMVGNFYPLPPHEPAFGTLRLWRPA